MLEQRTQTSFVPIDHLVQRSFGLIESLNRIRTGVGIEQALGRGHLAVQRSFYEKSFKIRKIPVDGGAGNHRLLRDFFHRRRPALPEQRGAGAKQVFARTKALINSATFAGVSQFSLGEAVARWRRDQSTRSHAEFDPRP